MDIELDFSEQIKAKKREEVGFEEEVSEETLAAEDKKGKTLNKPFRTPKGPKKFSVYVKNDKGNVVKVNFGDPNMEIKRDDPARRKSFRARHNCSNPGPKHKARYWSCKQWRSSTKVQGSEEESEVELLSYLDESDGERKGLWHNIREKKKREGKNYKPAKPGDKDRPDAKSWKKAQGPKKKTKADEKAGYPPKCNEGYEEKDGKCVPVKKDESEANQNSPRAYGGDYLEKAFMKHCSSYDKDLVNTAGMDKDKTYATCAMQYKKMKATLYTKGEGGLTEQQKKLPKPIQNAILKRQSK